MKITTLGIVCSGCVCCCAPKGSGGFVSHSPEGCKCRREIRTSDVSPSSAYPIPLLSRRPQSLNELSSDGTATSSDPVIHGDSGKRCSYKLFAFTAYGDIQIAAAIWSGASTLKRRRHEQVMAKPGCQLQAERAHWPHALMCGADMADYSDERVAYCASGWGGCLVWRAIPCVT